MRVANRTRNTNRPRGGFFMPARGIPLWLLQVKKDFREQNDDVDCDTELLEILRMNEFIGISELPEALRTITSGRLPTYWQLHRKAQNGVFPTYRAAGRIFVRSEHLTLIAEALGLKIKS
jgi:hypothetical protein